MFLQLILVLVVLIPILAIVLDSQVGRALASRLEDRSLPGGGDAHMQRLAFLEAEVERLAAEVERLDEEGRFLQGLIEGRTSDAERRISPGDDDA
jgi:cell division protein FtsB